MDGFLAIIRREIYRVLATRATTRIGLVDSYDPANHSAKVRFQPDDTLSGWIPIGTAMSGNNFGVHFAPNINDQVLVHFLQGEHESGVIGLRFYSDGDRPLNVRAGEAWLVHQTGSFLKLVNDGQVLINAVHGLEITGEVSVTGSLDVSGNVTIGNGASGEYTTADGLSVTVQDGITTNIV